MKQTRDRVRSKRDKLLGWAKRSSSKSPSPVAQQDTIDPLERISEIDPLQHDHRARVSDAGRGSTTSNNEAPNPDLVEGPGKSVANLGSGNEVSSAAANSSQHGDPAGNLGLSTTKAGVVDMALWQRAMDQLSSDERRLFESEIGNMNNMNGEDVFHALEKAAETKKLNIVQRQCDPEQKHSLRSLVSKTVVCLRRFKEVGDIAVSFDPTHAALPWAAVRFILEAITVKDEQFQLILIGLEKASYLGLRGGVYERLYNSNSQSLDKGALYLFETALISMYKEVLAFLALALQWLTKSRPIQAMSALFDPKKVEERWERMEICARETEREAANCGRWTNMTGRDRLYDIIDESVISSEAKIEALCAKLTATKYTEALRWVSPIPYVSDHETAREGRVEGTGDWLLKRSEFHQWYQGMDSRVLWLHGIPGAGKTKLSSKVVDYINLHLATNQSLAYFYCDRNREDHQSPSAVLRSLVRQLSVTDNGINIHTYDLWVRQGAATDGPNWELCYELLSHLIADREKTILLLDGLDECDRQTRHRLVQLMNGLVQREGVLLKIFVASRNDHDLWDNYAVGPHLNIAANDNQEDIRRYVLDTLENTSIAWWRRRLPKETKAAILNTFETKSEGMFQWAVLHMKGLLELERNTDVKAHLGSLPRGLEAAYENILEEIGQQAGSKPIIASRAFKWIQKSWRPLHPSELAALVCQSGEALVDFDPDVDINYILASCRNLLVVTSTHPVICRFSHLSVQEYLETHSWKREQDDSLLGAVCLQILMSPKPVRMGFLGSRSLQDSESEGSKSAETTQPHHTDSQHSSFGVKERLSESFGKPYFSLGTGLYASVDRMLPGDQMQLREAGTPLPRLLDQSFRGGEGVFSEKMGICSLKDYTDHWYIHFLDENGENSAKDTQDVTHQLQVLEQFLGDPAVGSPSYREWVDGLQNKSLRIPISGQFDKDLWLSNGSAFGAVALGLQGIILSWLDSHAMDPNLSCDSGSLFHLAAMRSSPDICAVLFSYGADVNALCPRGTTPLLIAVEEGTIETVEYLLQAAHADPNEGIYGTYSALGIATSRWHGEVVKLVKLVLKHGGDINPHGAASPLHAAIDRLFYGPELMQLLLANGADPNLHHDHYGTPLQHAVGQWDKGTAWAIDLLLHHGADVNLGRPLYLVLHGFQDSKQSRILQRLINAGALDYVLRLPPEQRTPIDREWRVIARVVQKEISEANKHLGQLSLLPLAQMDAFRLGTLPAAMS